jgi:protein-tyrosine-phosphatase
VLTERLRGLDVVVSSAGVRARTGATMTPEAVDLAVAAGSVPARRVEAMLARLATARGEVEPPVDLTEDDVIDPIGRSRATYERAAAEMGPGIDAIGLLVRLALEA